MRHLLHIAIITSLLIFTISCINKVPNHIIAQDKMVNILVDVHKSEAYIENLSKPSVEFKMGIRQSVFDKHGVDQQLFDSSLMWYGQHLEYYVDIYKEVMDSLNNLDQLLTQLIDDQDSQVLTAPGDSVNIWKGAPYCIFDSESEKAVMSFNILADGNFRMQDRFILSLSLSSFPRYMASAPLLTLAVKYRYHNGIDVVSQQVDSDGKFQLELQTDDSAIESVFGSIYLPNMSQSTIPFTLYADSIAVTRIHTK